jgi:hypothetical protein
MIDRFSSIKEKKSKIQAILTEWSLAASFHCYPKLFQQNTTNKARFIWLIFLIIFMSSTIWLISNALFEYFQFETISKIEMVTQNPGQFPTITICNSNSFTTKQAEVLFENVSITHNLTKTIEAWPLVEMLVANDKYFNDSQRQELGFNLTQSLFSCTFNAKPCEISDFHYVYHFKYGNCFQFNHDMKKFSRLPGVVYGLQLIIGMLQTNMMSMSKGLVLFIHNQTNPPSLFDNPILLETGKETNVEVKRTFTHNTPRPYSECTDKFESELARFIPIYKQKNCLDLCLQKLISDGCKCFLSAFSVIDSSLPGCLNMSQYECIGKQFSSYIYEKLDYCNEQCPLECDSISYEISTSSLDFPTRNWFNFIFENSTAYIKSFESIMNRTLTYESFKESNLALNIFYPSLKYTQLTESPKTSLIDLVSNVGGLLGIFLGFSIFSIVEILEIIARIIWIYIGH